jgi:DnaJ-class molecular chaperone
MPVERMTAFVAVDCDTPVEVDVECLGAGAGRVRCFECGGTGESVLPREIVWNRRCNDCKGSGFVLVSV